MYGLVLAGGGGKGGYHIGVWKALKELNLPISAVTGTSVGALNGAFVAQDTFDDALSVWENITVDQVINVDKEYFNDLLNMNISLNAQTISTAMKHFEKLSSNKGLDITPLKTLIETYVDEKRIRNAPIAYGLVTVSISDLKPLELFVEEIPEGQLVNYMLASSFLPGFMPMLLDGKHFIDGGFHDNLPINLMASKGIKNIIAVDLKGIGRKQRIKYPDLNIIEIKPTGELGKILEFDAVRSQKDIQMGYLDTLKTFGHCYGLTYYYTNPPSEELIINALVSLSHTQIKSILRILGLKAEPSTRILFEQAIPMISSHFGGKNGARYQDLLIQMIEYLASLYKINNLVLYDFSDFIKELKSLTTRRTHSKSIPLPFFPLKSKERMIKDLFNLF